MKIHESLLIFFLISFPSWTFAGWQIVQPATKKVPVAKDQDAFIQASRTAQQNEVLTKTTTSHSNSMNSINESPPASDQIYRPIYPPAKPVTVKYNQTYNNTKTTNFYTNPSSLREKYRYPSRYVYIKPKSSFYAVSISGSVKENVERIMRRYHWKVVWKAPYDYNYDGRITGTSLPNVIEKLFQPFPLQAVMYVSNRTLTVVSRNKT